MAVLLLGEVQGGRTGGGQVHIVSQLSDDPASVYPKAVTRSER
jgi:hypothetical protein